MKAIVETGYKGYVAQEFILRCNRQDRIIKKAIQICGYLIFIVPLHQLIWFNLRRTLSLLFSIEQGVEVSTQQKLRAATKAAIKKHQPTK